MGNDTKTSKHIVYIDDTVIDLSAYSFMALRIVRDSDHADSLPMRIRRVMKAKIYEDVTFSMVLESASKLNLDSVHSQYKLGSSTFDCVALKDGDISIVAEAKTVLDIQGLSKFILQTSTLDCKKIVICGKNAIGKDNSILEIAENFGIIICELHSEYKYFLYDYVAQDLANKFVNSYSSAIDILTNN